MAPSKSNHEAEAPHNRYEALYEAMRMTHEHFKKLNAKLVAEQQKRMAENQAKQPKILEEWRACRERDEIRIAEIAREAAPRDILRLAQLEEEKKRKKAARQELIRKIKEAKKEEAKEERLFRKDMRERNYIHNPPVPRLTRARVEKAKRVSPRRKLDLEKIAEKGLANEG
ncbi:actin cytoskeleton-regulatory complex protein end3 [Physcia stellaris]|nr:actin cytoskeleton-regulatory complex protein end3 [Physcia stellaris]